MSDLVKDISFGDGDEEVKGGKIPTYKVTQKGATDRIAITMRRKDADGKIDMTKLGFAAANVHYHAAVGYFLCNGGYCCERTGAPFSRVATIVIKYPTDRDGNVDKAKFGSSEILPWLFRGDKYDDLKRRNKSNPLDQKDIEITCKDVQFQKMDIIPSGEALWLKNEEFKAKILKKTEDLEKALPNLLGRKIATEELKQALGEESGEAAGNSSSDSVDYSEALKDL